MKKRFWIPLLSSAIASSAFGFNAPYFDGFYAGLSAGATQTQMKLTRDVDIRYLLLFFEEGYQSTSFGQIYREVPIGELHLGYGHKLWESPFYLGAEVFGNFSRRKISAQPGNTFIENPGFIGTGNITQTTHTSIRLNNFEYGADLRPGFLLSPSSLLYARIGAAFNELKTNKKGIFTIEDINFGGAAITNLNAASKKNVTGLRLGLGMAQRLSPHWALTADYIFTDYGHISTNGLVDVNNITNPVTPNGYVSQIDTEINTQTITLGVNYYFDPNFDPNYDPNPIRVTDDTIPLGVSLPVPRGLSNTSFFNSFYAGIKGGALQNQIARNIAYESHFVIANLPSHTLGLDKSANHYSNSESGELFLGYGHLLGTTPFYLSAEVFGNIANHSISTRNTNVIEISVPPDSTRDTIATRTQTSLDSIEYGGDVKPGVLLTNKTLVYGRIGIAFNTLKINSNNTFIFENMFAPAVPPILVSTLRSEKNKTVRGLRLGLGVEEALSTHLSANFDYIYTNYGKINVNGETNVESIGFDESFNPIVATTPNGLTSHIDGKFTTEAELVGLTYHFD